MPVLTSIGGRSRLVAVSCAAVCAAVVVSWHMRARRRASTSLRASLIVGGLNAPSVQRASDNDCDAPEKLAAEFQEAASRASRPDMLCSDEQRLQLYALYKQATAGTCASPAPSRLDLVAHAKWRSWQQVAALTKQSAMAAYISLVDLASHAFCYQTLTPAEQLARLPQASSRSSVGLGPVQSTLASSACLTYEAESDAPDTMLACAKAGDAHGVAALLARGAAPDTRDACGRTPLLWAADGGSAVLVVLLLAAGARVDAPDEDGSTPLLHAALCGHESVARALLAAGADAWALDSDGCCAADVRPAEWSSWWPRR